MTGFLASTHTLSGARFRRAASCLEFLGTGVHDDWKDEHASIALSRMDWELADDFSAGAMILERGHVVVAADATLYDRRTLLAELHASGVRPAGSSATDLIAAAYRAWDLHCVEHLNGDFAFVIWDRTRQRIVAARDIIGMRPLFYSDLGGRIVVGSSARAVAESIGRGNALNIAALGAQVTGFLWSAGSDTVYDGVEVVPAAHLLIAGGGRVRLERYWRPPSAPAVAPMSAEDARVALRDTLISAVSDRVGTGRSTVWMSGGWDSTAVFAAGQHALPPLERKRLRPVSISYPADDVGCEDELIRAAAGFWGAQVQWVPSTEIPFLDDLDTRAQLTDEPPAHLYELWNRALARGSRATGARIAFDGCGGDNLFQVSDVIVADLVRCGQWIAAARHLRARRRSWRHAARLALLPLVPPTILDGLARAMPARVPRHYMESDAAPWVRPEFVAHHELREREIACVRAVRGSSHAQTESMLYLTLPIWSWGGAFMRGPLLQEGVETRSPLLDRRVIELALSRPIHERAAPRDTKLLLRGAMEGLLPPRVLERRPRRTGTTIGFSRQRMRETYPALVDRLFSAPLCVADLGMVDPAILRSACERVLAGDGGESLRVNLFHAMKVEFWLRGLATRSADVDARSAEWTSRQVVASCAGQSPAID